MICDSKMRLFGVLFFFKACAFDGLTADLQIQHQSNQLNQIFTSIWINLLRKTRKQMVLFILTFVFPLVLSLMN